jgi:uncharacterized membrane protein YfcA
MKFVQFLIDLIYWVWLFLIPTGILGVYAYYRHYINPKNLALPLLILIAGIVLGIWLAEGIRRKRGLAYFFSRINASPDFDKFSSSEQKDKNASEEIK